MNPRSVALLGALACVSAFGVSGPSSIAQGYPADPEARAAKRRARLATRDRIVARAEEKRARKANRRATTALLGGALFQGDE